MAAEKIPVAVLGATGSVGQRFVQLLESHPWFELAALTGSERRIGKIYRETCDWVLPEGIPEAASSLSVLPTSPDAVTTPVVFSALPSSVAREIEPQFAKAGRAVFSNAGAFRMEPDVPILLPEINHLHLKLIEAQRRRRRWKGFIVTNSNCTSTGVSIVLSALQSEFGVKKAFLVSLQALSGAGYPGVPSLDIQDNVIPFISNEEEKLESEPLKITGEMQGDAVEPAPFTISAHCNRVAVRDGHLVCMSIELMRPADAGQAAEALKAFQAPAEVRALPSCPDPVILVRDESNRPQPQLDRMEGNGMTTVVGRIRPDPHLHLKMVVLSHNTIRGAAGGSILNAELAAAQGLISKSGA